MGYKTLHNGIIFIEGVEQNLRNLGKIVYKKGGLINTQLSNLDVVKQQLSIKAKKLGGNAIINFKYGQKSRSWFGSLLVSFDDDVNWYGNGEVVILAQDKYNEIINQIKNA